MTTGASVTAIQVERIREQIRRDAPDITRRIREAADANQGSEARFRTLFAHIIEPWANQLGVPLLAREERTLATGRADATYNRMVIEYEAPGRLRDNVDHAATAHAIQQARDYVEGVARQERQQIHRLIGVVIDGCYFIYVRKVDGHWTDPEVEPVNEQSVARFLRLLVSLTSGKALLPENLVQDFGSNTLSAQRIASSLYQALARRLDQEDEDIVQKLFEQWEMFFGEITGYDESSTPLRSRPELRQFARGMGLDVQAVDPTRLFFTVHTYFALLIKLIAFYALSRFHSPFGTRFGALYQLSDDALRNEMEQLEQGGMFRPLGIRNFLEGDFFKWYLHTWDHGVATAIRTLLDRLKDYDPATLEVSPEQARDLLKKLYHRLMPREIRHDLGEYYTPDWLADHVLNELGYEGQVDKRLLDPACGSGTFLVLAIRRMRERCFREGLNEQETLELILNNIVGIDLNPLAVVAARTNYLLALGDLLHHRTGDIDIPVYLADSILTPAAGTELFNQDRYEISTVVGQFDIPSCLTTRAQIDRLCNLLEECVTSQVEISAFLDRARQSLAISDEDWLGNAGRGDGAAVILRRLYERLTELHGQGLDGIWARILQNAFMPLFLGRFDLIAGNPPWIGWESLPSEYRSRTRPLWERYGLFPHAGMDTILGRGKKDLSMLMSYVVSDRLLRPSGQLGFVITQTVFKTGTGQGFRRFRFGDEADDVLRIERVDDLTDFQPFEGATNRTATFVWTRDRATRYPVPYYVWQKTAFGQSISQDAELSEAESKTRRLNFVAEPVNASEVTSSWITALPQALDVLRGVINRSSYDAHAGSFTGGANAVYWVEPIHVRPDGHLVIRNVTEGARRRVPQVNADIEADLVYPLLRGRDVQRWRAAPSISILMVQDPTTRRGIAEATMQRDYPRAFAYLRRFEEVLRSRAAFRRYFTRRERGRIIETGPFYSMFDVSDYTFAPNKVVWREQAAEFTVAAVISEDRPIIPDHKLMMVATETAEEAYYLAGMLGNIVSRYVVASYILSISTSTAILENLAIPRFDPANPRHRAISDCSARLHEAAAVGVPVDVLEEELDRLSAQLFGVCEGQLAEIQESYRELTKADLRAAREALREDADADADDVIDEQDDERRSILAALEANGEMTVSALAAASGIEADALRPTLRDLIATGAVEQTGRGRGTRYRLAARGDA